METTQPNIIFILIDDLGWMDLGFQGSSFYETPNIDKLARQGMRFSDAYASCPVCSPTRASVMSGKYPARVGVTQFIGGGGRGKLLEVPYLHYLPLEEKSIASSLRDGGYSTWHVGKWHLGSEEYFPEKHGFDVNIGGCHWGMPKNGYFSPYKIPGFCDGPEGEYLTDRLTDEAVQLIKNRNLAKPFFLHMSHYTVHIPIQAPEHLVEKYRKKAAALGLDKIDPMEVGDYLPVEHRKDQRVIRRTIQSDPVYAAMVQNLDDNVGRLLDTLEEEGIADSTVVFFTSDNGGLSSAEGSPTCNAPLQEGKGWMYEGGTREPLVVRWPDEIRPDSICGVPVTTPDFYPTMLEMAGLDLMPDQHVDGVSLMPLLKGGQTLDREAIFWHYPHYSNQGCTPGCSVRAGDYKLIKFFEDNRIELYNLREDVSEEKNLAEAMPEKCAELEKLLDDWLESVEAKFPEPNPDWQPMED
ncbi:MAG: sulfatase [Candidatus Sumerlaeia bacterium]